MLRTKHIIDTMGTWLVFLVMMTLGISEAFYLYSLDRYSLVYFGDSASHLVGSRKIMDWMGPGLPLPHFLLLPFTLIDQMLGNEPLST
jgi:hypothetical protein